MTITINGYVISGSPSEIEELLRMHNRQLDNQYSWQGVDRWPVTGDTVLKSAVHIEGRSGSNGEITVGVNDSGRYNTVTYCSKNIFD